MTTDPDRLDRNEKGIVAGLLAVIVVAVALWRDVSWIVAALAAALVVAVFWFLDRFLGDTAPSPVTEPPIGADVGERGFPPPDGVGAAAGGSGAAGEDPVPGVRDEEPTGDLDPADFDERSVEIKSTRHADRRLFSVRTARHGAGLDECADALSIDPRRSIVAVADGDESADSARWARTLARRFVAGPPKPLSVRSFEEWLETSRVAWSDPDDEDDESPESTNGVVETRASMVGAAIMRDGERRVATFMNVGDSCGFVLSGPMGERSVRRCLPYSSPAQFGGDPQRLGPATDRPQAFPSWTTVPVEAGDLVVLATSAVARWLVGDVARFEAIDRADPQAVARALIAARLEGRLVDADLALVVLEISA